MFRKPASDIARLLSIILGRLFNAGRYLRALRKQITTFKNGKQEDLRNCSSHLDRWER